MAKKRQQRTTASEGCILSLYADRCIWTLRGTTKDCEIKYKRLQLEGARKCFFNFQFSVLDACLVVDGVERGPVESNRLRAKEIGSGVSIKVWNELQQSNIEIDSELYYKVIQAICQTSELPSAKSTTRSLAALARVFKFSKDGMVNPEITRLVRANMTASQFTQLTAKLQI